MDRVFEPLEWTDILLDYSIIDRRVGARPHRSEMHASPPRVHARNLFLRLGFHAYAVLDFHADVHVYIPKAVPTSFAWETAGTQQGIVCLTSIISLPRVFLQP